MTQPTSRSTIKAIACSNQPLAKIRANENNGTIADQCKQRRAPCHIGLAKDRGGHLVNQPRLSLFVINVNSLIKRGLCRLFCIQYKKRGLLEYVYADLWNYVFIVKV